MSRRKQTPFSDAAIASFRRIFGYPAPNIISYDEGAFAFDGGDKRNPERVFKVFCRRDGTFGIQCRDFQIWQVYANPGQNGMTAAIEAVVSAARLMHGQTKPESASG